MLLRIPGLLSDAQVTQMRARLALADWGDGKVTAGHQSTRVKSNLQLRQDDPESRALSDIVLRALEACPLFISAALPRHVYPPLFNRYEPGMAFGAHVDNAIRPLPGTPHRLRTDMSATVFLSPPEAYDGGELVIEDTYGSHAVKLAAGDMVLYPANSLHAVTPVTRGVRLAAFFWTQSLVKDDGARSLLFDMDGAIGELTAAAPDAPALTRLTACYHNLLRRWAEL